MSTLKKRVHARFNVDWRAAIFFPSQGGEKAALAKVGDISLGGAALLTELAVKPGAIHRVAMAIPTFDRRGVMYIEGQYRVISAFYTNGSYRVSVKKESMSAESEETLLWFLREEAKRLEWVYSKATGRYEFVKESY